MLQDQGGKQIFSQDVWTNFFCYQTWISKKAHSWIHSACQELSLDIPVDYLNLNYLYTYLFYLLFFLSFEVVFISFLFTANIQDYILLELHTFNLVFRAEIAQGHISLLLSLQTHTFSSHWCLSTVTMYFIVWTL